MADTHTVTFKDITTDRGNLYYMTFTLRIFRDGVESLSQDFTEECSGDLYQVDYEDMGLKILPKMQVVWDQWKITHDTGIFMGMGFVATALNSGIT